jgi:hypothetical protein
MLAWDDVKAEFAWDGSWRDICVTGTTIRDWQAVLDMIRTTEFRVKFTDDGVEAAPPDDAGLVFKQPRESSFCLAVFVGKIQLNCFFFDDSEIEFDLDPREIVGQDEFNAVITFMAKIAATTNKFTLMTPENMHETAFIRVAPSGIVQYISTDGFFQAIAATKS